MKLTYGNEVFICDYLMIRQVLKLQYTLFTSMLDYLRRPEQTRIMITRTFCR